jgi:RimJ/RimL family protein N-acetyltransferase
MSGERERVSGVTAATEHLTLHPFTIDQAERVLDGSTASSDQWEGGYSFADELDLVREFLQIVEEEGDPAPFGPHLIRRGDSGPAVGGISFFGPPDDEGVVEFGFALVPAVRGNGYATEAVRQALHVAADGGARIARAEAPLDNAAAQRVLERAGMIECVRGPEAVMYEARLHPPTSAD